MNFREDVLGFIRLHSTQEVTDKDNMIRIPTRRIRFLLKSIPRNADEESRLLEKTDYDPHSKVIWEDQWLRKKTIVKSRMLSFLQKTGRIHGRECAVTKLTQPEADEFLEKNHLIGTTLAKTKLGLIHRDRIVSVATFSKPTQIRREVGYYSSFEMIRFCARTEMTVVGGLSKLIRHFIRQNRPDDIMTYVDLEWSEGKSFEKIGFTPMEQSSPQEFWINPKEMVRHYPHRMPATERNNAELLHKKNFFRIRNSGNRKFILFLK